MKRGTVIKYSILALLLGAAVTVPTLNYGADEKAPAKTETIKGEVVDMMCYLDHGAKGEKHKGCAAKCIEGGGPVGLLGPEHLYLVVGDHAPMNKELAAYAGQTISVKGKVVERHGWRMIENAEIVK